MANLWKILGGIGMAAASAVPGVGAVLGPASKFLIPAMRVGGSALATSGAVSGRGGGDSSKLNIDAILGKEKELSEKFLTEGADLSSSGEASVDTGLKYLTKILSGDKSTVTEALAPEYEQILSQYDTARRNLMETGPRGGAKGEKVAESYFSQADAMSRLMQIARGEAAKEVARIGEARAGRGVAKEVTGLRSVDSILQTLTEKRRQNVATFGDIGQGIGSIIAAMIFQGGGKGGGVNT